MMGGLKSNAIVTIWTVAEVAHLISKKRIIAINKSDEVTPTRVN
jgi:hypothetical protein